MTANDFFLKNDFIDYYAVLGVSPNASLKEIKYAYHILVMKYHPDKNPGETSNTQFIKIATAYELLQNPVARKKYHDRYFYDYAVSKEKIYSAENILQNCRILLQNLQLSDPVHMNPNAFTALATKVLTETDILFLLKEKNESIIHEIAEILLQCSLYLNLPGAMVISEKLKQLCIDDEVVQLTTSKILKQKKISWFWNRNQWWIILIVTLILCAIIFFVH